MYMSCALNLGWGGPIGDYIGFWGGTSKGYTTNLVQGSYTVALCHLDASAFFGIRARVMQEPPEAIPETTSS